MKKGTKVRIKGLLNAAQHNGKIGIVTKASAPGEGERVGVKLQDGSGAVLAIKIENLDVVNDHLVTTTKTTTSKQPSLPTERTLKREHALLREVDGSPDPNVLVLYYHFADKAFDCFNATEYHTQMLRYYEKGLSVKLIVPRMIGNNHYFLVGLQHSQPDKNSLCEVAFNCGRSFTGISMLVKQRCFACNKPLPGKDTTCPKCRCVCFCNDAICIDRHSDMRTKHMNLCQKIDLSKVVMETENIQLLSWYFLQKAFQRYVYYRRHCTAQFKRSTSSNDVCFLRDAKKNLRFRESIWATIQSNVLLTFFALDRIILYSANTALSIIHSWDAPEMLFTMQCSLMIRRITEMVLSSFWIGS